MFGCEYFLPLATVRERDGERESYTEATREPAYSLQSIGLLGGVCAIVLLTPRPYRREQSASSIQERTPAHTPALVCAGVRAGPPVSPGADMNEVGWARRLALKARTVETTRENGPCKVTGALSQRGRRPAVTLSGRAEVSLPLDDDKKTPLSSDLAAPLCSEQTVHK